MIVLPLIRATRPGPLLWGGLVALLLAPLVAMQFTHEVRWDRADFLAAALLLGAVGGGIELARRVARPAWRAALIAAVVLCATLIWADAAVGIF